MFPKSFDLEIYKNQIDLSHLNDEQLKIHYKESGKNEGRICSKVIDRLSLIKNINTDTLDCLEIGPFDSPILKGSKVKYFDVLNQDQLKKKSLTHNRNKPSNVPFIDFIDSKGNLKIIDQKFDIILSCHSIEHQLDFIQHLKDVSELMNDNGYYVIILPDKRYCFDHFINESSIADIISSHINKSNLHSIKSVIEHKALTCHNDPNKHWENNHGEQNYLSNPNIIHNAIEEYKESISKNEYVDVHSLQFTPESFENIINILNKLSLIDLVIDNVYNTLRNTFEFFVILKKKIVLKNNTN